LRTFIGAVGGAFIGTAVPFALCIFEDEGFSGVEIFVGKITVIELSIGEFDQHGLLKGAVRAGEDGQDDTDIVVVEVADLPGDDGDAIDVDAIGRRGGGGIAIIDGDDGGEGAGGGGDEGSGLELVLVGHSEASAVAIAEHDFAMVAAAGVGDMVEVDQQAFIGSDELWHVW
jgi:hypothetical protein